MDQEREQWLITAADIDSGPLPGWTVRRHRDLTTAARELLSSKVWSFLNLLCTAVSTQGSRGKAVYAGSSQPNRCAMTRLNRPLSQRPPIDTSPITSTITTLLRRIPGRE